MVNSLELQSKKGEFHQHVKNLQNAITRALQSVDPHLQLVEDLWERTDFEGAPGGGGVTRAFTGDIIENAGVNTSEVYGTIDPRNPKKNWAEPAIRCGQQGYL